jgi:hypothetical protein
MGSSVWELSKSCLLTLHPCLLLVLFIIPLLMTTLLFLALLWRGLGLLLNTSNDRYWNVLYFPVTQTQRSKMKHRTISFTGRLTVQLFILLTHLITSSLTRQCCFDYPFLLFYT